MKRFITEALGPVPTFWLRVMRHFFQKFNLQITVLSIRIEKSFNTLKLFQL